MNTVIEINGKHAVVMNENGTFEKIKNNDFTPGQRIESSVKRNKKLRYTIAAASAAFALFIAGGAYAYCTPYSQVSIDVNPSVVMHLNYFNKVIQVQAMNADAEKILEKVNVLNDDIQVATEEFITEIAKEGYVAPDSDAAFMVTTNSQDQNRAQEMLRVTEQKIEQKMEQLHIRAGINGECIGQELVTRAREYGISPGKLMLVERYALSTGSPENVDISAWINKSVKEIIAATNENRGNGSGYGQNGSNNNNGKAYDSTEPGPTTTLSGNSGSSSGGSTAGSQNAYKNQQQNGAGKQATTPKASSAPTCTSACNPASTPKSNPVCTSTCSPAGDENKHQYGQNGN
ncbi:MAG: anti-sigma-I factor RsgI family protein [Bacillota bacterium]